MSLTQFYNGRMIMDYSGKLAPVRMRIDSSQSEAASAALSNLCNILSLGKQIVETGEYTDYQIVTAFPDNSAINYNVYRLTLVDNIDSSVKEYMYIPSANLGLLSNNLDYIPETSSTFTQIASYVQPYYRSRLGNGCTLTAIEYVNQRNTIFPSQVGTATFAPQQVKTTNISENGQYIVNPDSGYIIGRNIINVNVPSTPSQSKSATYTSNGNYTIYPDSGYLLSSTAISVNVPNTPSQSKSATYTSNGNYTITPDIGYLLSNASITVNVPPQKAQLKYVTSYRRLSDGSEQRWNSFNSFTHFSGNTFTYNLDDDRYLFVLFFINGITIYAYVNESGSTQTITLYPESECWYYASPYFEYNQTVGVSTDSYSSSSLVSQQYIGQNVFGRAIFNFSDGSLYYINATNGLVWNYP